MTEPHKFKGAARPEGEGWWVEVENLPRGCKSATYGPTLTDAHGMATEAVAFLLDVPNDQVEIDLVVESLTGAFKALVDEAVSEARDE